MDMSQTTFDGNVFPANFLDPSTYEHDQPFSEICPPPPHISTAAYEYWNTAGCPILMTDIEDIFSDFAKHFGFQRDNRRNMHDHLLTMLDSRSARMAPRQALLSLHADYIGGENANYRKWYFASQLDLDDRHSAPTTPTGQLIEEAKREWKQKMESLSDHTRVCHLALYLLIWGEAATLRYMPELICFLFKAADDYRMVINTSLPNQIKQVAPESFLDTIITPIYQFARGQSYTLVRGECIRRERDHNHIIGYDDINQLFWDRRLMGKLRLRDGQLFKDIVRYEQFHVLSQIEWSSTFEKTFYETRSSLHLLTNFSRIWIIHAASFWYYMAANVDFVYLSVSGNRHDLAVKLSVIGLGGLVASVLLIIATLAEFAYLPTTVQTTKILVWRIFILLLLSACHVCASVYVIMFNQVGGMIGLVVASLQLGLGAILSVVLAIVPSANLFRRQGSSHSIASKTFTAHFPGIPGDDRYLSILLWICIFSSKFLETYFFLALSFRDALGATLSVRLGSCAKDMLLGNWICTTMPILTSILLFSVEFLLFFLDTYLWYVVWSTLFSVSQSMHQGLSVMTSWRTLFGRLPQQIIKKVVATKELDTMHLRKVACSQMWNAIVISMYREHLLSISNLQALLYQVQTVPNTDGSNNGRETRELKVPEFFDPKGATEKEQCFPGQSEAERRLSFFAQSLSTDIPNPCSIHEMPVFTVFTPHYAEKMLLSLREIIREEDTTSRVTLLEYLKKLHPAEWDNFVKDTKLIVEESENETSDRDDLPFYCIGFKSSAPEYTLRTRLWASQRAQTLYRTVCGFMNYARALKLLYRIEHPDVHTKTKDTQKASHSKKRDSGSEELLDQLAHQKFRFLVAMQRYAKFNSEEAENCEYLLKTYPHLQIAYIDEERPKERDQEPTYYSVLIDGNCERLPGNKRLPRYRIRLPGNPILGDGKSDNQNHALIFYRGEYLQLVDANQDNYLEECIKIRSIFREFEQEDCPDESQVYELHSNPTKAKPPVAIVGAREYIFSENVGVLGDIAAGKEQTFGTLTQRIMAKTGGRLHYGHPDFLNAVFMTTRGGVSKAQRGLHLNEDIYAGMNALSRGGKIKHTEYLQCGKGRDLGFCSILNFTTKIGTGMGEQLLSREYYYLGTQLPVDRFLMFYYAHPGFHMNNIMIIFTIQVFLICMMCIGAMADSLPTVCQLGKECFNLRPVTEWIQRCVLSVLMVFFVSFLPLFLQELTEKGTWRSLFRLFKQFFSLSPLFEVFVTQIYANAVLSNLSFGGARYIATGRGFATARLPFSVLYSRFANPSIYFGSRTLSILVFVTLTMWLPHLVYFWVTVSSLIISPFVFNPHQFVFVDFITDYKAFLGWLCRGQGDNNQNHAWITFCRESRMRVTGQKNASSTATNGAIVPRARFLSIFMAEMAMPLVQALVCLVCYLFLRTHNIGHQMIWSEPMKPWGLLGPLMAATMMPIIWNIVILLLCQCLSVSLSVVGSVQHGVGMAALSHGLGLLGFLMAFEYIWFYERFSLALTVMSMLVVFSVQRFLFKSVLALFLTREPQQDGIDKTWWTGRWWGSQLGRHAGREFICKIVEMSVFTTDFVLGHLILFGLFPFTLIPCVDRLHSIMLFWLKPSHQIRSSVLSTKQRRKRRGVVLVYGPLFVLVLGIFGALIVLPPVCFPTLFLAQRA
ncbi:hypothetical protein CLU79DRAFT_883493 [Phycomyces nitens]|nr:hypothetical protein CLU79DRAFT_883493 [Phycomyces nitens]